MFTEVQLLCMGVFSLRTAHRPPVVTSTWSLGARPPSRFRRHALRVIPHRPPRRGRPLPLQGPFLDPPFRTHAQCVQRVKSESRLLRRVWLVTLGRTTTTRANHRTYTTRSSTVRAVRRARMRGQQEAHRAKTVLQVKVLVPVLLHATTWTAPQESSAPVASNLAPLARAGHSIFFPR